jgi:hypothetical protein
MFDKQNDTIKSTAGSPAFMAPELGRGNLYYIAINFVLIYKYRSKRWIITTSS